MRSRNYYRLRFAVRLLFWAGVAVAFYLISSRLWWDGSGYCWGDALTCVK